MIKIKILSEKKKYPTKLSVFDFDGTLFKSPDKPEGYKGNWWAKKESLGEPTVPKIAPDEFWNLDVVAAAYNEINDPNVFCIMLTGRIDQFFQERIEQLLSQKRLNFSDIELNKFGQDTGQFKINKINSILKKFPSIKIIEMWEDEPEKAELYTDTFQNKNIKVNLIK